MWVKSAIELAYWLNAVNLSGLPSVLRPERGIGLNSALIAPSRIITMIRGIHQSWLESRREFLEWRAVENPNIRGPF